MRIKSRIRVLEFLGLRFDSGLQLPPRICSRPGISATKTECVFRSAIGIEAVVGVGREKRQVERYSVRLSNKRVEIHQFWRLRTRAGALRSIGRLIRNIVMLTCDRLADGRKVPQLTPVVGTLPGTLHIVSPGINGTDSLASRRTLNSATALISDCGGIEIAARYS